MPKPPAGDNWEYFVEYRFAHSELPAEQIPGFTMDYLNGRGIEGWELISVLLDNASRGLGCSPMITQGMGATFIFKRRIK